MATGVGHKKIHRIIGGIFSDSFRFLPYLLVAGGIDELEVLQDLD